MGQHAATNQPSEWIRVSCATLCRVEHGGRFFLLLNLNRREKGLYILSPIGGALGLPDIQPLKPLGAIPENAAAHELRLALPKKHVPAFRRWFYAGVDREQSPFRELYEELVLESKLLLDLTEAEVTCRYLWTIEEIAATARQGQTGLMTYYFLEIYDVKFTAAKTLGMLLSAPSESGAAWVQPHEMHPGTSVSMFVDGELREVRVNGQLLLPRPQVYPSDDDY